MSVIDSQPSPFGHLTRERHIEFVSRLPRKKPDSSGAEETSRGEPAWRAGSDALGIPRSLPGRATHGSSASVCGARGHGCHVDTGVCSKAAPLQSGCRGSLALPLARLACEGGLAREQAVEEKEDGPCHGLQILAGVQRLRITSKAELQGVPSNFARRGYIVSTAADERPPLVVTEEYSPCCFHLCGPARSCHLSLQDQEGHVILWFCRPFRMGLGCLCCCPAMEMRAFTSDNQLVGTVHQRCRIFSRLLEVRDACGSAIMTVHGSAATCRCFTKQEFQVLSPAGHVVASIWKNWPGFREERNMDHEFFGLDMAAAADLSNGERACLLAATFLLNFMFFEVS